LAVLAHTPPAAAEYAAGAEPASATATDLGDRDSTAPALSADGRYVVFRTESALVAGTSPDPAEPFTSGIVRKDLLAGGVELVAPPGAGGATSISGDGRYVLFETTLPLSPGDANTRTDVYLRDMTRPLTDVDAYELVSSLDGPPRSPTYRAGGTAGRSGQQGFGLSRDGRTAVFWTGSQSNLPGGGAADTPRSQVFVRSLDSQQTRLVTRDKDDPTLPGTPVAPDSPVLPPELRNDPPPPQPVLSGDGTVVAWQDVDAGRQTRFLPGETPAISHYLWRDLAAGPTALARRVTGASDLDDPACPPGAQYLPSDVATGPCYGPFASSEAMPLDGTQPSSRPLSISDDGRRLVFISAARRRPYDAQFQRPGVYLVDMREGLSRKQGTSEPVSLSKAISELRPIQEAVISGDGRHIVFSSRNNAFDGPVPIGSFQSGELTATNVFVLDLDAAALERVTRGLDGGDYRGRLLDLRLGTYEDTGVQQLAASSDAGAIAFQADDGNLFVGDANGVKDVQVARRVAVADEPAVGGPPPAAGGAVEPVPVEPPIRPLPPVHPVIGYVQVAAGGVASLRIRVPAAGRVSARANGRAGRRRLAVGATSRTLAGAATVTLRLPPSAAARRALRRAPLAVTLQVRYRPLHGASSRASRRYTLARGAAR
ncbi:MAG TPA: hypothetical protein VI111_08920, partial [Thermoleophilaceae bacterium]